MPSSVLGAQDTVGQTRSRLSGSAHSLGVGRQKQAGTENKQVVDCGECYEENRFKWQVDWGRGEHCM